MSRKYIILAVITLISISALAQEDNDFMKNSEITGKIMEFMENVRYIRGDFKVVNPDYILTAGQGKIDQSQNIMEAYIKVKLVEEKYTLTCNKLIYHMDEEKAVAIGEPKIIERARMDTRENSLVSTEITGSRILNYIKEDRVVIEDNVVVEKKKYNEGREQLDYRLYCDNLTYYNAIGKAVAIGNVRIERVDSTAYGDRLVFYDYDSRIEIVGNASIEQEEGDRVFGEKIVYFNEDDRVIIFNAKAEIIPSNQ